MTKYRLPSSAHISSLLRRSYCYARARLCSPWIVPSWRTLSITSTSSTCGKTRRKRKNIIRASPFQTVNRIATRTLTDRIDVQGRYCRRRAGSVCDEACDARSVIATAVASWFGIWDTQPHDKMTMDLLTSRIRSLATTKKDHKDARQTPAGPLQKYANVKQLARPIDNGQGRQITERMITSFQMKPQPLCGSGALIGGR
jgi:hypothetical protein